MSPVVLPSLDLGEINHVIVGQLILNRFVAAMELNISYQIPDYFRNLMYSSWTDRPAQADRLNEWCI